MKAPLFIRPLTTDERDTIQASLRSSSAFVLRRCQIVLASARQERASSIARSLGCDEGSVRNMINGFNEKGLTVHQKTSCRPHRLRTSIPDDCLPALRDLLHRSPREFGIEPNCWSLPLAAKVAFRRRHRPSEHFGGKCSPCPQAPGIQLEARQTLDHESRSDVSPKQTARDRLIAYASPRPDWAIGFLDQVCWSRFALPHLHAWQSKQEPVRLVEHVWQKGDPDPKALACYGVLWQEGEPDDPVCDEMWLRLVTGRPVSAITIPFLEW